MSALLLALLLAPPDPAAYRVAVEKYLSAAEEVAELTRAGADPEKLLAAFKRAFALGEAAQADPPPGVAADVPRKVLLLRKVLAECVRDRAEGPETRAGLAAMARHVAYMTRVRLHSDVIAALGGAPALAGATAVAMPAAAGR